MTKSKLTHLAGWLMIGLFASGCTSLPSGLTPVSDFELQRYLGRWYEIARLDHSFERGLTKVTAEYSLREAGGVLVVNRGYDAGKGEWNEAQGKAYFIEDETVGRLKVSFFGPFYGAYNIIELDKENYEHVMIAGPNRSYLWILARDTELPADILQTLVERAADLGFATDELIYVAH